MTYNSVPPYVRASTRDVQEAIGITVQPAGDENSWYQILGGLIFQGGLQAVPPMTILPVNFVLPYPKKVLGIWLQTIGNGTLPGPAVRNIYASIINLSQFTMDNDYSDPVSYFWLSIGY